MKCDFKLCLLTSRTVIRFYRHRLVYATVTGHYLILSERIIAHCHSIFAYESALTLQPNSKNSRFCHCPAVCVSANSDADSAPDLCLTINLLRMRSQHAMFDILAMNVNKAESHLYPFKIKNNNKQKGKSLKLK